MHALCHRLGAGAHASGPYGGTSCAAVSRFLIKIRVKEFADQRRSHIPLFAGFPSSTASFASAIGILSSCSLHLTFPESGNGAWLDRLSVRCLSSYLFFCPYSGDNYACRLADAML